ncbi:MAG: 5'/3'-nucleotidase SurE [Melioribacteraceae bacterium]|nr:5'/3'-nucleotidase SurE [Melioribacteraceae bacterium]
MKILICNDDGIGSEGIYQLADSLSEIGDITVIAPTAEQSAVGHSITMKVPLRFNKYNIRGKFTGYAVDGTPADCVKFGIKNILKEQPDIVVSGINHGANTAISIIYSGTVSAAREAAIMDCPAIAFSITDHRPTHFEFARKVAKDLTMKVAENGLKKGTLLNVNIPNLPEDQIKGIIPTKQGTSKWDDIYEERMDPYGNYYYWLTGVMTGNDKHIENDQIAVKNKYVSVTPIHFDLTDYDTLDNLTNWNLSRIK